MSYSISPDVQVLAASPSSSKISSGVVMPFARKYSHGQFTSYEPSIGIISIEVWEAEERGGTRDGWFSTLIGRGLILPLEMISTRLPQYNHDKEIRQTAFVCSRCSLIWSEWCIGFIEAEGDCPEVTAPSSPSWIVLLGREAVIAWWCTTNLKRVTYMLNKIWLIQW